MTATTSPRAVRRPCRSEEGPSTIEGLTRIFHPTGGLPVGHYKSSYFIVIGAAEALSQPPRTHLPPDPQPGACRPTRSSFAYPAARLEGGPTPLTLSYTPRNTD